MTKTRDTAVLIWRNLAPYHIARATSAAKALSKRNCDLTVIELCGQEATRDWKTRKSDRPFNIITVRPNEEITDNTPSMLKEVLQHLDTIKPGVVGVAGYDRPEMRGALKWCKNNKAISVVMSETKWNDNTRPFWKRIILKALIKDSACLVSGSESRDFMLRLGIPDERIFTGYGVVDNEYFSTQSDQKRSEDKNTDQPYFLTCCRLIEKRKNLRVLIEAYKSYRANCEQPWPLIISGDGPDRAMLEQYAKAIDAEEIIFTGFNQIDELTGYYASAGCLIHPALKEAWGLVINEAMASGLPILVSRQTGSAKDLVNEGENGFSFDGNNPEELTEAMCKISDMTDTERQNMSRKSKEIIEGWAVENFGEGLLSAYALMKEQ